ncbi:MAG: hypothetical protein JOY51_08890 [Nevskia sp.]|nr:hypothetical protein [Nevskia sp.]
MNRLILIAAAAALSPAALAADPAPAPAAAPATAEAVPASTCVRPQIQYDAAGKIKNAKELQPQVNVYQNCTDAYVAARKQSVADHDAAAKAHRDAGNDAVKQFNDFVEEIKAAQAKK